jgi:hypothetical protein
MRIFRDFDDVKAAVGTEIENYALPACVAELIAVHCR